MSSVSALHNAKWPFSFLFLFFTQPMFGKKNSKNAFSKAYNQIKSNKPAWRNKVKWKSKYYQEKKNPRYKMVPPVLIHQPWIIPPPPHCFVRFILRHVLSRFPPRSLEFKLPSSSHPQLLPCRRQTSSVLLAALSIVFAPPPCSLRMNWNSSNCDW